jgi:hypothetical protein
MKIIVYMEVPEGETEERCVKYVEECLKANRIDWDEWEHFKDFYSLKIEVKKDKLNET